MCGYVVLIALTGWEAGGWRRGAGELDVGDEALFLEEQGEGEVESGVGD